MRSLMIMMVLLGVLLISACLQQEEAAPAPVTPVPATPAPEPISEIEILFAVCAGCHGSDGSGAPGIAPAFQKNDWVKGADLEEIKKVIREGRGFESKRYAEYASTMPSWSETYSGEEIAALAGYVKSLSQ